MDELNNDADEWSLRVRIGENVLNTHGRSNKITTTKYNLLTWLPVSLLEQFRRIANVYFLCISILMLIGTYATYIFVSPLDPYSTVMTLTFVLMVTCVKEGYEDLQRYRSDRDENNRHVTVVRFDQHGIMTEKTIPTQNLCAGDIIKLTGTSMVPADMVLLLTSSYADGNQCFVETANIDGETNLKTKEAPHALAPLVSDGRLNLDVVNASLTFEPPNKNIHNFVGTLRVEAMDNAVPLSAENLLLRGSLFSNTDWCYGVAVYMGQESKIQMNNKLAKSKMSKLEVNLNRAIIIIFCAQVVLVSVSVISLYLMGFQNDSELPYVYPPGTKDVSVLPLWLEQWFVFFLLYNNFIPISIYVTIELVNLGQGFLISSDHELYDKELDMPCAVRSSNLAQELGMVSNVFSDKTGTLTCNVMKLVRFVVDGHLYDITTHTPGDTREVMGRIQSQGGKNHSLLYGFYRCLIVCHTVVREKSGDYRAESPDELALVEGIGGYNCQLLDKSSNSVNVTLLGAPKSYDVLAVNAFNSDRKRMSVLVRDVETGEYFVMCKGADNIMLPLCNVNAQMRQSVDKSLLDMANLGLRTLCIGEKKISESEAKSWLVKYRNASAAIQNRAQLVANVAAELEVGMTLLGVTAIEDKLQDEVPSVIADLAVAGIVVWMLTGDKEETAINIGHSCNLLLSDTKLFMLTRCNTAAEYTERLQTIYMQISNSLKNDAYAEDGVHRELALVMDGPSFKYFDEQNADHRKWLLFVGKKSRSVIGCRLTPIQKQQVVRLVKVDSVPQSITLSIGDGANDVSMIREANVGVGIFGKEGRQAANNADFAIGQFKYLRKLVLVHGRWNYGRQSRVFLYSMHKNMVLTLTLFWYSYFTAVSGTSMYDSWIYTGFNFYLGLPIIFYGIQDRDISAQFALENPQTYATGQRNRFLKTESIMKWIWNALLYAILICLVYYYAVRKTFEYYGLYEMGTTVFTGMCLALQVKVILLHHQWTWPQVLVMTISVGGMFLYYLLVGNTDTEFVYVAQHVFELRLFWFFGFFSIPMFCLLLDKVGFDLVNFFKPSDEMLFREIEHVGKYRQDWLFGDKKKKISTDEEALHVPVPSPRSPRNGDHATNSNNNNSNSRKQSSFSSPAMLGSNSNLLSGSNGGEPSPTGSSLKQLNRQADSTQASDGVRRVFVNNEDERVKVPREYSL